MAADYLSKQVHDQSRVLCLVRSRRGERKVSPYGWWFGLRVVVSAVGLVAELLVLKTREAFGRRRVLTVLF